MHKKYANWNSADTPPEKDGEYVVSIGGRISVVHYHADTGFYVRDLQDKIIPLKVDAWIPMPGKK